MKLGELRRVFETAANIYRQAADEAAAEALKEISSLSSGRDSMTVAAFAKLVGNCQVNGSEAQHNIHSGSHSSVLVNELGAILSCVQQLCTSAGAKTAAKDLQTFSDMLKSYSDLRVDKACAEINYRLSQSLVKPARRAKASSRTTAALNENAVQRHLAELRDAGTDQQAFDLALQKLKASKSIKLPELAEIARQFSLSVTAYRSKTAAHADIERAFIQQARFENKLR